jgi:hypothetical protein
MPKNSGAAFQAAIQDTVSWRAFVMCQLAAWVSVFVIAVVHFRRAQKLNLAYKKG